MYRHTHGHSTIIIAIDIVNLYAIISKIGTLSSPVHTFPASTNANTLQQTHWFTGLYYYLVHVGNVWTGQGIQQTSILSHIHATCMQC